MLCTTCPKRAWESTFLRCHNVGSQRADKENMMRTQCVHKVEWFAGNSPPTSLTDVVVGS